MSALRIAHLVAVLAAVAPTEILSQDKPSIKPGSRVRVTAPSVFDKRVAGTVSEVKSDTLAVSVEEGVSVLLVSLKDVTRLEVSHGRRSHAGLGAKIGAMTGFVTGFVLVVATYEECTGFCPAPDPGPVGTAAIAGLAFGIGGAALGAIVGALIKTDRWEEIPLDELRIEPSPVAADGVSVSASIGL